VSRLFWGWRPTRIFETRAGHRSEKLNRTAPETYPCPEVACRRVEAPSSQREAVAAIRTSTLTLSHMASPKGFNWTPKRYLIHALKKSCFCN
jgi:hypothetical protein